MRQADLNRAVARATGESVDFIEQMGFGLLTLRPPKPRRQRRRRRRRQRSHQPIAVRQSA